MTAPSNSSSTAMSGRYENKYHEYTAVILAATVGTRLFPLTDASATGIPKHLLPVAGVPILQRLLHQLAKSSFSQCVVAIAQDDEQTIKFLRNEINNQKDWREVSIDASVSTAVKEGGPSPSDPGASSAPDVSAATMALQLAIGDGAFQICVVRLAEEGEGSVGAVNQVEETGIISPKSSIVVLPGDLVLLDDGSENNEGTNQSALSGLIHAHRLSQSTGTPAACAMLLSDMGEQDENGMPLKESAKQKKGGFAREQDDIEYIALSYSNSPKNKDAAPRVVWKQSKLEAEEDKDMTGQTPKLQMPKPRLRMGEITRVRTDWTDVHVYVLSPWVRQLLMIRNKSDSDQEKAQATLISFVDDVLPLLISRQFLGISETFGSHLEPPQVEELLRNLSLQNSAQSPTATVALSTSSNYSDPNSGEAIASKRFDSMKSYSVIAHVQNTAFRSATISAYLYASKDLVAKAAAAGNEEALMLPENASMRSKFQSVVLPGCKLGDKVTFKSTIVGRNCTLGSKCRLNNVILLDGATLGDQVSLQNTIVGRGATIGDNCSLNDCQVAPGKEVPTGTKAKGEALANEVGFE